jgi:hypothetical protein
VRRRISRHYDTASKNASAHARTCGVSTTDWIPSSLWKVPPEPYEASTPEGREALRVERLRRVSRLVDQLEERERIVARDVERLLAKLLLRVRVRDRAKDTKD